MSTGENVQNIQADEESMNQMSCCALFNTISVLREVCDLNLIH
jgi:hypothetical protein